MRPSQNKVLYIITIGIIVLSIAVTGIGVFYSNGGEAYDVTNQYGEIVKIYGDGIYSHDSYFKAPIFRGSDLTMLFFTIPLLVIALVLDFIKNTLKQRLFLNSVIAIFTYYSSSIIFGVTYNAILLLYIALFSFSFFGLVISFMSIDRKAVEKSMNPTLPYRGIYVFLWITGIALFVAWLPDIISALLAKRPLEYIEVYTTEITYALDMGIIAPLSLICFNLLKKRDGMGYVLLEMLLTVCIIIGVMLPVQTLFQLNAGIEIPIGALITKVSIFCLLALFALYFNIRFMKACKS